MAWCDFQWFGNQYSVIGNRCPVGEGVVGKRSSAL